MASYTCMYTKSQKGIKMRMETIVGLYRKGNEIISWSSLCVGSWFVLNNNCRCMRCRHRSMLHQIWTSWIGNDNVYQGLKIVSNDDNIHSSSCVARKKVKNLFLYVGSTFQCNSCNGMSKRIMGHSALIPTRAM
jgi:hypothetical protein